MKFNRLLLITQLHRSGGTLFSQLLDGHSMIQAHPHELFIGKPEKWDWPDLTDQLGSAEQVFASLREEKIANLGAAGNFIKPGNNKAAKNQTVDFNYSISTHEELFTELYYQSSWMTQRLAIQLYLSTFFEAWPQHQASGREIYTSCFLPHILLHGGSMQRLLRDFPDLLLVNIIRRPDTWIASLVNHINLDIDDIEQVSKNLERWKTSVKKILTLHANPCLDTFATTYEALVLNPRAEMQRFCTQKGLCFEPLMLTPSVGGFPVLPNSSYKRKATGVNTDSVALKQPLPAPVSQLIDERFLPLYQKACTALDITEQSDPGMISKT